MLAEVFHIFIEFCVKLKAANTLNTMKALQVLKALNALKVWKKLKARNHPPIDSTPNPSCSGWQSERRHVDQPRQRNCSQVLQGGYPPEGPVAAGPAIFGYVPSLESNPPEAGPVNET